MFKKIIAPLRAIFSLSLYVLNIFIHVILLILAALIRIIVPIKAWRAFWYRVMHALPISWIGGNSYIFNATSGVIWDIELPEGLDKNKSYLLFSNHQAWADILVLTQVFNRKIPSLKFFMKKELQWVPLVGLACKLLDFPSMARHSREALKKNPALRDQDLNMTRKSCEKFKTIKLTLGNYAEGTRFTTEKHRRQSSPYQYLLKPKAGGLAFSLDMLGDQFAGMIDATIIYMSDTITFWDVLCGRLGKVVVRADILPITQDLIGDYYKNAAYRKHFQSWINARWKVKDALISQVKKEAA